MKKLYKVRRSSSTETSELEEYSMNAILNENVHILQADKCKIKIKMNKASICFKIDTGTEVNVLTVKIYNNIKPKPKLNKTSVKLTAYNNTKIPVTGSCTITLQSKNSKIKSHFIATETNVNAVIITETSEKPEFIKSVCKINKTDTRVNRKI